MRQPAYPSKPSGGRVPQYSIKIKDLVNNTTSVVNITASSTREANQLAIKRARLLLGMNDLEVSGVVRYQPIA